MRNPLCVEKSLCFVRAVLGDLSVILKCESSVIVGLVQLDL